ARSARPHPHAAGRGPRRARCGRPCADTVATTPTALAGRLVSPPSPSRYHPCGNAPSATKWGTWRRGVWGELVSAVWFYMRTGARRTLRPFVSIALLIGLSGGIVLAALSGAHRTDTAYPRFL